MIRLNFLKNQIIETRNFTKKLIAEMPEELWFTIPENTNSNFAWQIGHIALAQNYQVISCAFGIDEKVMEKMPIREFGKIFTGLGSPNRSVDKDFVSLETLKENFEFVNNRCLEKLDKATDDILEQPLEPTQFKNPIASKKYDVISWSFKHEMWHCAEMEQVKIALNRQFKWLKQ